MSNIQLKQLHQAVGEHFSFLLTPYLCVAFQGTRQLFGQAAELGARLVLHSATFHHYTLLYDFFSHDFLNLLSPSVVTFWTSSFAAGAALPPPHMGQTRQEVTKPKKIFFSRLQIGLQTWYYLFWGSKWFLPNKYAEGTNLKRLSGPLHLANFAKTPP